MSPFSLIKYLQFSWPITIILIVFFQIIVALFPDVPRIRYAGTRISYVKRSRFFVSLFRFLFMRYRNVFTIHSNIRRVGQNSVKTT